MIRYCRIALLLLLVVTYMQPMMRVVVGGVSRIGSTRYVMALPCRNLSTLQSFTMSSRWFTGLPCPHAVQPERNWKVHAQIYNIAPGSPQEQLQRLIVFANNKAEKLSDHPNVQALSWRDQARHYQNALQELSSKGE